MQRPLPALALLSTLLSAPLAAPAPATPVATTEHFAFHSEARINLHHFLYQWAVAEEAEARRETGEDAGERRRPLWPVPVAERGELGRLSQEERETWGAAVAAYRRHAADRSLLFDGDMLALRDALDGTDPGPAELAPLREALEAALPVYRRHWWPAHRGANRRWIADLLPALVLHAAPVVRRLEEIYASPWHGSPVRVDVSAYANSLGAYTAPGPRTTISSTRDDYAMPRAFEMVFHEASHSDRVFGRLHGLLREVYAVRGAEHPPRDLWHALLFYSAGAAAREVLDGAGVTDGYVTYAEHGLWRRGRWADFHAALKAHWQPYLDGETPDRRTALERVAAALAASPSP